MSIPFRIPYETWHVVDPKVNRESMHMLLWDLTRYLSINGLQVKQSRNTQSWWYCVIVSKPLQMCYTRMQLSQIYRPTDHIIQGRSRNSRKPFRSHTLIHLYDIELLVTATCQQTPLQRYHLHSIHDHHKVFIIIVLSHSTRVIITGKSSRVSCTKCPLHVMICDTNELNEGRIRFLLTSMAICVLITEAIMIKSVVLFRKSDGCPFGVKSRTQCHDEWETNTQRN